MIVEKEIELIKEEIENLKKMIENTNEMLEFLKENIVLFKQSKEYKSDSSSKLLLGLLDEKNREINDLKNKIKPDQKIRYERK